MKLIDDFLDKITMYKLLLYYLLVLIGAAMGLSAIGQLSYNPLAIAFSAVYLSFICWSTNEVFGRVYKVPTNFESSLITALILALIITPLGPAQNIIFLTAAGGLAIASKYILAIGGKHFFNPAAIAVVLTSLGATQSPSWWIGNIKLMPIVLLGGVLLLRKIKRTRMVVSFILMAALSSAVLTTISSGDVFGGLRKMALHSSLLFLAFVMLTEPQTSPTTTNRQNWYGALAGLLFPPQVHLGTLYSTPELALVVSNIFSYLISPKTKLLPRLVQRIKLAPRSMDFIFAANQQLAYEPGQYMEWTLPHRDADARGSQRYFTLASSPTENNIRLGVKFYENGSSFKRAMLAMKNDTPIAASQVGGDFRLPKDKTRKLVFIAGGIGITPFRSMLKYLIDSKEPRTITLLYSERKAEDVVYTDVFEAARRELGTKVVYTLTDQIANLPKWAKSGYIDSEMIKAEVPDFQERIFYISGPHSLVSAMESTLLALGINRRQIKTDFFPGYA